MNSMRAEEKAALLLAEVDEDEQLEMNNSSTSQRDDEHFFPVVAKRPRTYHRHRSSSSHPILCLILIFGAFTIGCVSGIVIMLYRMAQDAERGPQATIQPNSINIDVDFSIQRKLFQSIGQSDFQKLNRSSQSEVDAAKNLFNQWNLLSPEIIRVNQLSYETNLAKLSSSNTFELLDNKSEKVLIKIDGSSSESFLSFSSLLKSGVINTKSMYYVNYGREEDFAYLFRQKMSFSENAKSIVFMRRKSSIISVTEQIRQSIRHRFAALVLFDDIENDQISTTNDRVGFFDQWRQFSDPRDRDRFVEGISPDQDRKISLLTLSFDDVQRIFASLQPDSNFWISSPPEWNRKSTPLKLGGVLSSIQLRLSSTIQESNVQLPVVMAFIRGKLDSERFILISHQLKAKQQNHLATQILRAYSNQMKTGWNPRRSILFCAWSGLEFDHFTVRRWLSENSRLVDQSLVAHLDLGNDVMGNGTLNLHGSSLLEQVAHHAADSVSSPLVHNHTCHHRDSTKTPTSMEDHEHGRRKRRQHDHEHQMTTSPSISSDCETHKLLDEWIRVSKNRTRNLVQTIDVDSTAALFQLKYGIPSLLIEMTDEQFLSNETFYARKLSADRQQQIEPEVYLAYSQFVLEVIRQLVDEPLIPFNLTFYANQIDKFVNDYLTEFSKAYLSLGYHLGDPNNFRKTFNDLTKSIRQIQSRIDQLVKTDFLLLSSLNKKLLEFERLFIFDRSPKSSDETFKHVLIGPAFGLTNTIVPFPLLSNLLYKIPGDPPTELCDAGKLFSFRLKDQIESVRRTLDGLDALINNNK